jgi:predicted nucleotidyltransferase
MSVAVLELAVLGSVARGDAAPASDVNVLYVLRPDARLGFATEEQARTIYAA